MLLYEYVKYRIAKHETNNKWNVKILNSSQCLPKLSLAVIDRDDDLSQTQFDRDQNCHL